MRRRSPPHDDDAPSEHLSNAAEMQMQHFFNPYPARQAPPPPPRQLPPAHPPHQALVDEHVQAERDAELALLLHSGNDLHDRKAGHREMAQVRFTSEPPPQHVVASRSGAGGKPGAAVSRPPTASADGRQKRQREVADPSLRRDRSGSQCSSKVTEREEDLGGGTSTCRSEERSLGCLFLLAALTDASAQAR